MPKFGQRVLLIGLVCGEAPCGDRGIVKADLAGVVVVLQRQRRRECANDSLFFPSFLPRGLSSTFEEYSKRPMSVEMVV